MPDGSGIGQAIANTFESGAKAIKKQVVATGSTIASQTLGTNPQTTEDMRLKEAAHQRHHSARLEEEKQHLIQQAQSPQSQENSPTQSTSSSLPSSEKSKPSVALRLAQTKVEGGKQAKG